MNMTFDVTTHGYGAGGKHQTDSSEFWSHETRMGGSPEYPNPLELLLGSLTGCMNVVLQMVAHEKGWQDVTANFRVRGELDPRGFMGDPTVSPYFHTLTLDIEVAGIPHLDLDWIQGAVGRRCPVHRLFEQAGVHMTEQWTIMASKEAL